LYLSNNKELVITNVRAAERGIAFEMEGTIPLNGHPGAIHVMAHIEPKLLGGGTLTNITIRGNY
jgi:hypothetical protein